MSKDKKIITLFAVGIAGVLFSGYLSGVKFFLGTCAFNEGCPYFLGYPACYYGFALFFIITILGSLLLSSNIEKRKGFRGLRAISFLGILFAGYFTLQELPVLFEKGISAYILGLPTCALGLIFYVLVFVLATYSERHEAL